MPGRIEHPHQLLIFHQIAVELIRRGAVAALRRGSDVPIIFITALSDEEDKLFGYELGAGDYMTKPFSMSVLYAKIEALIKRSRGNLRSGDRLEAGGISLEQSTRRVFVRQRELSLTPKEYSLLYCLIRNKNVVLSREQLLVKCWGYNYDGDIRAVDSTRRPWPAFPTSWTARRIAPRI